MKQICVWAPETSSEPDCSQAVPDVDLCRCDAIGAREQEARALTPRGGVGMGCLVWAWFAVTKAAETGKARCSGTFFFPASFCVQGLLIFTPHPPGGLLVLLSDFLDLLLTFVVVRVVVLLRIPQYLAGELGKDPRASPRRG